MSRCVPSLDGVRSYTLGDVSSDSEPGSFAGEAPEKFSELSGLWVTSGDTQVSEGDPKVSVGDLQLSGADLLVSVGELSSSNDK